MNDQLDVPRLARSILLALTPNYLRAQIDGDLREAYAIKRRDHGRLRAHIWFWRQLISVDVLRLLWNNKNHKPNTGKHFMNFFTAVGHDVRFGLRALRKRPLFTLATLGTLALGIGATTAIFTVVNAVLLRPLPYENADELVMVFRSVPQLGFTRSTASFPDFDDWRNQSNSFRAMGAYGYATTTYLSESDAVRWQGYRITANLFSLLGVAPSLGRPITASDDVPSASDIVVLSHALWQDQFGEDSTVVGRTIVLDGKSSTVVGVMPIQFSFPSRRTQYWTPLRGDSEEMERDSNFLTVIARLHPKISVQVAQDEMTTLAGQIDATMPGGNRGYGIFVESRQEFLVRNARTPLLVFMGAVGLVLIVALTNVANIMLAKGTTRTREIAVRTALGASRGRMIRQLLTESTLLAVVGGVLGLATASVLMQVIVSVGSGQLPRIDQVQLDPAALLFVSLLSVGSGIAFGTIPALIASGADPQRSLKDATQTIGLGRLGRRLQHMLVIGQIAMAMMLTIGAGLLLNSFARLTAVDPGFQPENIVAGRVAAPRPTMGMSMRMDERAREAALQSQRTFYETVLARSTAHPGVISGGLSYGMPLSGYTFSRVIQVENVTYDSGGEPMVNGNIVSGNYFPALGIPIIQGRAFTTADRFDTPSVIVVNEGFAKAYWPGKDAIGKRLKMGSRDQEHPWSTVIGIVPNVLSHSLSDDPQPTYYRPYAQAQWPDAMYVVLRSTTPPEDIVRSLRNEIRSLNAAVPLTDVTTASQLIAESVAEPRFRTLLLSTFGAVAAILALVGIYSVIAFTVEDRTHEIGIRLALGANRNGVMRMVLTHGAKLAGIGVVMGLAAAAALTRFLASMLYDITPYDPLTYAACAVVLVLLSVIACYVPARNAAASDPLKSLRFE